jgi:hypothetical protein
MTLILMVATAGVLTFLGVSCRNARLDLEEQICDCLQATVPAAVGFGVTPVEVALAAPPVLTPIDGGRAGTAASDGARARHLRVVRAG